MVPSVFWGKDSKERNNVILEQFDQKLIEEILTIGVKHIN